MARGANSRGREGADGERGRARCQRDVRGRRSENRRFPMSGSAHNFPISPARAPDCAPTVPALLLTGGARTFDFI